MSPDRLTADGMIGAETEWTGRSANCPGPGRNPVEVPTMPDATARCSGEATPAGMPAKVTRWSPEQRAATEQRRRVVVWLMREALIPSKAIQAAFGGRVQPTQDAQAIGYRKPSWLTIADHMANEDWRSNDARVANLRAALAARPPNAGFGPHVLPQPPGQRTVAALWLLHNSTETAKAVYAATGSGGVHRVDGRITRLPALPCRSGMGRSGWSLGDLDRMFPDMSGAPVPAKSGPGRGPIRHGAPGTGGYQAHRRRGETPCDVCAQANTDYHRGYRAGRAA